MKKCKGIFTNIEKKVVVQCGIFTLFMTMLFCGYNFLSKMIIRNFEIVNNDFSWVYQIDNVEKNTSAVVFNGWAFKTDKKSLGEDFIIILIDLNTKEKYYPKMKYMERKDVNNYFEGSHSYLESGFSATISKKKIDIFDSVYEIFLCDLEEDAAFATGMYFMGNEIYYTNPVEYEPLDVVGTSLEKIVANGLIRLYRPDKGVYVYQYEDELYWITDTQHDFFIENWSVLYHAHTTQWDRLPKGSIEKGIYWENLSFKFSSREYVEFSGDKYLVAKEKIPTDYAVSFITTGQIGTNDYEWMDSFYLRYEFD